MLHKISPQKVSTLRKISPQTIVPLRHGFCERKCKIRAVAAQRRSNNRSAPAQFLRKKMQKLCRRCHSAVEQAAPLRHGFCENKCKIRAFAAQRRSNKPHRSGTSFAKTNAKAVPSLPSGGRTKSPRPRKKRLGTLWLGSPHPSFLGSLLRRLRRPSKEAAKPHHFSQHRNPSGERNPRGTPHQGSAGKRGAMNRPL